MEKEKIQKCCEILEELLDRECKEERLTMKEFDAINNLLFELQCSGIYELPEKYNVSFN